jgi:hypothetical protein
MPRGQQRKIRAPGVSPAKRQEYAASDWRTGAIVHLRSARRDAQSFCQLAEQCLARSARRKRRVILLVDNFRIHTPEGSRLVAALLKQYGRRLTLRYIPKYAPDCLPMELFWNDWRDHVTHNHGRERMLDLESDSDGYYEACRRHPEKVLRTLGSPFAHRRHNRKN